MANVSCAMDAIEVRPIRFKHDDKRLVGRMFTSDLLARIKKLAASN